MIESAEEFVRLRGSHIPAEYGRAAAEPATVEVWKDVIARYPGMRRWVAHNKTVPLEILELLAVDPDSHVRGMVAVKRKLTPEILTLLSNDQDESVRLKVALHRRTSVEVLERLVSDPWLRIREVAEQRITRGRRDQ